MFKHCRLILTHHPESKPKPIPQLSDLQLLITRPLVARTPVTRTPVTGTPVTGTLVTFRLIPQHTLERINRSLIVTKIEMQFSDSGLCTSS